jgi:hypothetical protein
MLLAGAVVIGGRSLESGDHFEFRLWHPKRRARPRIPPRRDDAP